MPLNDPGGQLWCRVTERTGQQQSSKNKHVGIRAAAPSQEPGVGTALAGVPARAPSPGSPAARPRSPESPPPSLGPQTPPRERATLSGSAARAAKAPDSGLRLGPAGCALPRANDRRGAAGLGVGKGNESRARDPRAPPHAGNPATRCRARDSPAPRLQPRVAPPSPRAPPKASAPPPRGHSVLRTPGTRAPAPHLLQDCRPAPRTPPGGLLPPAPPPGVTEPRAPTSGRRLLPSPAGFGGRSPATGGQGGPGPGARSGHWRPEDPGAPSEAGGRPLVGARSTAAPFPASAPLPGPPARLPRARKPLLSSPSSGDLPCRGDPRRQSVALGPHCHCHQDGSSHQTRPPPIREEPLTGESGRRREAVARGASISQSTKGR
ncbi:proline-rich protein 2-like [Balaenoptera ricei]|uniref:proline-rich protein 2-like n=1 Tax=Balaenoptera ricei TaxID=2746895 RepID=UPI0028BF1656|nr:proline-rich protein 2-like [Balaenoptera ricei]